MGIGNDEMDVSQAIVTLHPIAMKRPPLSIIIIGSLFIATGILGIAYNATELKPQADLVWVLVVRFLAIVGGVFLLRGARWAR